MKCRCVERSFGALQSVVRCLVVQAVQLMKMVMEAMKAMALQVGMQLCIDLMYCLVLRRGIYILAV